MVLCLWVRWTRAIVLGLSVSRIERRCAMTTSEAIRWAGSRKDLAAVLGIWPHGIYRWGDTPPPARQWQLEALSGGELRVDPELRDGCGDFERASV